MSSDLITFKLGDVADVQTGPFGSQLHQSDYCEKGIPIITVEHLGEKRISYDSIPQVNKEDYLRLKKYVLGTGDMVFSRVGSVDRCSYVSNDEDGWLFSGRCLRVRPTSTEIYPVFLYYYFCQERVKEYIRNIAVGATMPSINTKILSDVSISIPKIDVQKAIAATLSCLDDKIEINSRMNKSLEVVAQEIFKSWFVDFKPFQDGEFVDSELGRIPKGWKVKKFSDLVAVRYGKDHKKLANGTIPVYGSGGLMRYADRSLCDSETVLIPRKGSLNNILYICEPFWSVDTMFYTEMKFSNIAKYIYHFIKGKDLVSMNCGSAVPSMTTDILNRMPVIHPAVDVLEKYDYLVSPLYSKMDMLKKENVNLASLRDTLLPKLMSGEIRVPIQEE